MKGRLAELIGTHHDRGRIDWIGLRSARLEAMDVVSNARIETSGLTGDHGRAGKRAVTLIQAEHLPAIAALCGRSEIAPDLLRRNILVSGINLTALRNHPIKVGTATLKITSPCAPCSRMEAALGRGGYNAMRGHGGWCAEVLEPGDIEIGSPIAMLQSK